ncbi:MAG: hypothetical protein AB7F96_14770 [Beijerinckiaceae bacterium]
MARSEHISGQSAPFSDLTPLILDFLEWVAAEPRPYADVMDAWRTSCPRLTVWEDCVDRGLITREYDKHRGTLVIATGDGLALLAQQGRRLPQADPDLRRAAAE